MKKCCKCKIRKDALDFCKDSGAYDGLDRVCRVCRSEYRKENREKENERKRRNINLFKLKAREISAKLFQLQNCVVTNCTEIGQRHHLDYSKPEQILFLCKEHHMLVHYH